MPFVFQKSGRPVVAFVLLFVILLVPSIWCLIDSEVIRRSSRWKRQTLPSDNVQVYSMNSNVSITEDVEVNSRESRIELRELRFDGTLWSTLSTVHFDPQKGYINLTAQDVVARFTLNKALFEAYADGFRLNETTDRGGNGNTDLLVILQDDVNLSFTDSTSTEIEAAHGQMALIRGNSWQLHVEKRLELFSSVVTDLQRQLLITAINNDYNIQITLLGAQVGLLYGRVHVEISDDYRTLVLTSEAHRVELKTVMSPFNLSITDRELTVRCPDDTTTLRIMRGSSEINIEVEQLSALHMDRSGGSQFVLQGRNSSTPERLNLNSRELSLRLNSEERNNRLFSLIRAQSNRSQLILQTNMTRGNFIAARHLIDILGGAPHLYLDTGNITLDISTNRQDVSAITLLPAFTTPANQFTNIGPFDNGNSGNQIDETIEGWRTRTSNSGVTRPGSSSSVSGFSWPTIFPLSIFATTITTPISDSIEDDFPRPSPPDNFTFQQFGPDVTTPNGTFQVLATIVTVSMPIATTFPETNQLSNFSPDNNVNTRRSRETNHKGSLLELHLQLNDTVKIRDKRFLKNLEDSLSSIAQSILYPNESEVFTRKKRNLDEVKIKIDKTETLKDHPNDVSILFYVDQPNDFDENPMLAIKLNDVGVANLSEKLGYPVVSEIVVREPSASTLAIIAIATSGVLCFFLILFMGWQCKIREKRVMAYLRRSRVSDSTVEINRVSAQPNNQ